MRIVKTDLNEILELQKYLPLPFNSGYRILQTYLQYQGLGKIPTSAARPPAFSSWL